MKAHIWIERDGFAGCFWDVCLKENDGGPRFSLPIMLDQEIDALATRDMIVDVLKHYAPQLGIVVDGPVLMASGGDVSSEIEYPSRPPSEALLDGPKGMP